MSNKSRAQAKRMAYTSAMSLADDIAQGRVNPEALDAAVIEESRRLFGTVVGPGDPLWELQVDIARQAIALGALSSNELQEWVAVLGGVKADAPTQDATDE
ncbi:flagellar hook-length control protein [Mycolicibacterium pulveris]|uniref:flagellar hook-length control protein n=1 Tax=Mycolicibacterium pulveris TaxID=36813 RepID=UPI003CE7AA41